MPRELVQDSLRLGSSGFTNEQRVYLEPAADSLFDQPYPFNGAQAVDGLALAEGLPKLLYQRVLAACNGAQSV